MQWNNKDIFIILAGSAFVPLALIILNKVNELSFDYIAFACSLTCCVVFLEWILTLVTIKVMNLTKSKAVNWVVNLFIVSVSSINIFSLSFSTLPLRYRYGLSLSILIATIVLTLYQDSKGRNFLKVFSLSILIFGGLSGGYQQTLDNQKLNTSVNSPVDFGLKKNLYLVVFDSIISKEAYSEIYGQDETPWGPYLRSKGFNVVDNAIAAGAYTQTSFATLFAFGEKSRGNGNQIVGTRAYSFFESNNYKIKVLSGSSVFQTQKSKELYLSKNSFLQTQCDMTPLFFLYDFCGIVDYFYPHTIDNSPERLLQDFSSYLASEKYKPQSEKMLTVMYVWFPGHSPSGGKYQFDNGSMAENFKSKFITLADTTPSIMNPFIEKIIDLDKNAVVAVFSDHGSHFYRGVSDDGNSIVSSKLKRLDNLGSIFAIYPKDVCSNVFKKNYEIRNLLTDLVTCKALE